MAPPRRLPAGATVVLSSTVPAGFVQTVAGRLAERGLQLLDAPVSGGAVAAEAGELTIMASGPPEAFAAADPALEACAKVVYRLGAAPGIGSSIKAVNQLLAGVNLVTAAEGMAFGVALGADPKVLYEVIRGAAGGSWMFDNRVPHMLNEDYTPRSACDIWVKWLRPVVPQLKARPSGIESDTPGATSTISSVPPNRRHMRPLPERKYQTSSTVRCATARETCPGPRVKCAMLPRDVAARMRTSQPSGAITSASRASILVAWHLRRPGQTPLSA